MATMYKGVQSVVHKVHNDLVIGLSSEVPKHFSAPSCWCAKSSAECGVVIVQLQRLRWEGSVLKEPEGDGSQEEDKTSAHSRCYDHALLVTGYDVLLSTLQGNLSFSTSSVSSFASTHAGPDYFRLF